MKNKNPPTSKAGGKLFFRKILDIFLKIVYTKYIHQERSAFYDDKHSEMGKQSGLADS